MGLAIASLAVTIALVTSFPKVTPVAGKPPLISLSLTGFADARLGFTVDGIRLSSPVRESPAPPVVSTACSERNFVDDAGALPTPCRAGVAAPAQSLVVTLSSRSLALERALEAIDRGDLAAARATARGIDPIAEHIVAWMSGISGTAGLKSSDIAATIAMLEDWPGQSLLRSRYEAALAREQPGAEAVLRAFAAVPPATPAGTVLFAKALAATGKAEEANRLVRRYWREELISRGAERAILAAFGGAVSDADHRARVARLLYQGKVADAEAASQHLDKGPRELVRACIAVARQRRNADKLLDKVQVEERQDPIYRFARIQWLRQSGHTREAAALMLSSPTDPGILIDPDAWSEARRDLARDLATKDPRAALKLTAANLGASATERMDAEFEAGWYALRYLNDATDAARHFGISGSLATRRASQARAEYWLGRAFDAAGQAAAAAEHYRAAASHPTAFYGQLALINLGSRELPIAPPPTIDQTVERRFLARELVQVAGRLTAIGRHQAAEMFYRQLAETLTDPAEIALLAALAQDEDNYSLALQVGKVANARQSGADSVAFPMEAVPSLGRADVELPAIYAVARQESAFQVGAVSPVGAQGLLQLMPATAREVAGRLGMSYSKDRLSTDAAYNATLGAAFLGGLVVRFNGSYALGFAAYNAGEGRVQGWVKSLGDPRDPGVDVVDWIERIPFAETRNYVQRTLENLQVYRARLGSPELRLETDLTGGRSGS